MKYGIFELMLAAVVISFVGFAIENTWLLLTKGYMDNRNMTLPFLLGYGILMVDFYLMFGTPSDVNLPIVSDRFTDREIYFFYRQYRRDHARYRHGKNHRRHLLGLQLDTNASDQIYLPAYKSRVCVYH